MYGVKARGSLSVCRMGKFLTRTTVMTYDLPLKGRHHFLREVHETGLILKPKPFSGPITPETGPRNIAQVKGWPY